MRARHGHPRPLPLAPLLLAALALGACGDGEFDDPVPPGGGGGAGDAETLAPFVGTWDLTGPWRGDEGDEAYLVIGAPDEDGRSAASLYDFDEIGNCYVRPVTGAAEVDDFGTGVFMNDIFSFERARLEIDGAGALLIEHTDVEDADGDGDRGDRTTYRATRNDGLAEQDLEPRC